MTILRLLQPAVGEPACIGEQFKDLRGLEVDGQGSPGLEAGPDRVARFLGSERSSESFLQIRRALIGGVTVFQPASVE